MEIAVVQKSLATKAQVSAGRCDGEPVALNGARRVRRRGKTPSWQHDVLIPLSYEGGGSGVLPPQVPFFCGGVGAGFFRERKASPQGHSGRRDTAEKQAIDILP